MSETRKEIVRGCFKKFDHDGSHRVELQNLKGLFNARDHPDVKRGNRRDDDVMLEFLETFETHHRLRHKAAHEQ